jgi:hypothetical protein
MSHLDILAEPSECAFFLYCSSRISHAGSLIKHVFYNAAK